MPFDGFAGRLIYDPHYWSVFWTLTFGSYCGSGRYSLFPGGRFDRLIRRYGAELGRELREAKAAAGRSRRKSMEPSGR